MIKIFRGASVFFFFFFFAPFLCVSESKNTTKANYYRILCYLWIYCWCLFCFVSFLFFKLFLPFFLYLLPFSFWSVHTFFFTVRVSGYVWICLKHSVNILITIINMEFDWWYNKFVWAHSHTHPHPHTHTHLIHWNWIEIILPFSNHFVVFGCLLWWCRPVSHISLSLSIYKGFDIDRSYIAFCESSSCRSWGIHPWLGRIACWYGINN